MTIFKKKKKKIFPFVVILITGLIMFFSLKNIFAEDVLTGLGYGGSKMIEGIAEQDEIDVWSYDTVVDSSGNYHSIVQLCGMAQSIDLDWGTGESLMTISGDGCIYGIATYSSTDEFVSAFYYDNLSLKMMKLGIDGNDNIYVVGQFTNSVDFDFTGGTDNKSSAGLNDTYIMKVNSDGSYGWARQLAGTGDTGGWSIAVDSSGDAIYFAGRNTGEVDMDPGLGEVIVNFDQIFVEKLNLNGEYQWHKTYAGTTSPSLFISNDGDVWAYHSTFFQKISSAGVDLETLSPGSVYVRDIKSSPSGDYYLLGYFNLTKDFDFGAGIDNKTSAGGSDAFVTKWNSDESYAWTKIVGGTGNEDYLSLVFDSFGNMYIAGETDGTVDLDMTFGTDIRSATVEDGKYLTLMNSLDEYIDSYFWGPTNRYDNIEKVFILPNREVRVLGNYRGFASTDPISLGPNGYENEFPVDEGYDALYVSRFFPMIEGFEETDSPEISLDTFSPNPTPDTTPSLTGLAIDISNVSEVEYQIDSILGSWGDCTANDGGLDSTYEKFTCTVSLLTPLEEGEHTMYVRATDGLGNRSSSLEYSSISFTVDTTLTEFILEENEIISSGGDMGNGSSIVVGPDGFPRISHIDYNTNDLYLVVCEDKNCQSLQEILIEDGTAAWQVYTSIDIGTDGFARIAYLNNVSGNLRYARCNDYLCTNPVITEISQPVYDQQMSIVQHVGTDGFSRIFVISDTDGEFNRYVKYLNCNDSDCTNPTIINTGFDGVSHTLDMVLDSNNSPYFSLLEKDSWNFMYGYCTDTTCSSIESTVIAYNQGNGGAIALGEDGFARLAYVNTSAEVVYQKCLDIDCATSSTKLLDEYVADNKILLSLGASDVPTIGFTDDYYGYLYSIICEDDTCSSSSLIPIETTTEVDGGTGKDMAISDDGQDVYISYYDYNNYYLGFAHLSILGANPPGITLDAVPAEISTSSYNITGSTTDSSENIYAVHYQVDGYLFSGWTLCSADDGTFDEVDEDFTCSLSGLSNGEHTVYVRATDSDGNATTYPNHATATFTVNVANTAPDSPTNLTQYKSNGTTVLSVGANTDESSVILRMTVSDDDNPDTLTPQVEVRPIGVVFTDTVTHTGSGVSYSGTPLTTQISLTGLIDTFSYHWQARVCDASLECSSWVSYGLNSESSADFVVLLPDEDPISPTPVTTPEEPIDEDEEVVDEEELPIDEGEENEEEVTPPVDEEKKGESIFVRIGRNVSDFVKGVVETISNIELDERTSSAVAVGGYVVATSSYVLVNFITLTGSNSLGSLQLMSSLFVIGGLKKKKQKYGIVYDSVSKEPINTATVRVMDELGKLVTTVVTDVYGVFDLQIPDGRYRFDVVSRDHVFPSKAVLGVNDDPYQNVYKGGLINYSSNEALNISIPMDRENKGFIAKTFASGRSITLSVLGVILKVLFVLGFVLTLITLIQNPTTLTIVLTVLYIISIFLLLYISIKERRSYGVVRMVQGSIVEGLEIGLRELEFDKIYSKRVSSDEGKYRFIVPGGKYRLEILNSNYELVGIENDSFEIKDGTLFIIKEDITVKRV